MNYHTLFVAQNEKEFIPWPQKILSDMLGITVHLGIGPRFKNLAEIERSGLGLRCEKTNFVGVC